IQAVDNAHVEIVRILLEAGADRNARHHGRTALQIAKERLRDDDYADQKRQYQEIATLLADAPTKKSDGPANAELEEVKQFAENARRPEYVQLRKLLAERCGEARPWAPLPDHGVPAANVVACTLADCKRQKALDDLQQDAR